MSGFGKLCLNVGFGKLCLNVGFGKLSLDVWQHWEAFVNRNRKKIVQETLCHDSEMFKSLNLRSFKCFSIKDPFPK